MTVNEVSRRTGLSIRTLQYYDNIGLLNASAYTEAGYRLYEEEALERLQQILLFRELLKCVKESLCHFERSEAESRNLRISRPKQVK